MPAGTSDADPRRRRLLAVAAGAFALALLIAGFNTSPAPDRPESRRRTPPGVPTSAAPVSEPPISAPTPSTLPLADSAYPVPADARFVAPSGSDTNPGTRAAPLATLARAVALARPGTTIVLRAGTYHESIRSVLRRVTIQPFPHERVWLDGRTRVDGWTKSGAGWLHAAWDPGLCQTCFDPRAILPAAPAAGSPDMVFVDGVPQRQVAELSALAPATFFVDPVKHLLYTGTNPTGRVVTASVFAKALQFATAGAAGSVLRGIGIVGYASAHDESSNSAMVIAGAPNLTFENDTFASSASRGLAVFATGAVVRNSLFIDNGYQGLVAYRADGLSVESSRFVRSNAEHFVYGNSAVAAAAGAKITTSNDVTVRDSVFEDNAATGLWFDVSDRRMTVVRNLIRRNLWRGLIVEISTQAVVASNVLVENGSVGLAVSGSTDVRVWNNTLANNGAAQLGVYDDPRTNRNAAQRRAGLTWDTEAVSLANNVFASHRATRPGAAADLVLVDTRDATTPRRLGAAQMITSMDDDLFSRSSNSRARLLADWATLAGPQFSAGYSALAQFRSATGHEAGGIERVETASSALFVDERSGDYHLVAAVAAQPGAQLPPDVAAAIGGSAAIGRGAGRWPSQ